MVKMIVIKIGSSLLSRDNRLDNEMLKNITRQACILRNRGIDIILVSSGAVSSGMATLGLKARPNKIANLQACASLGQGMLMKSYIAAFAEKNLRCAQLLLTSEDFSDRKRYLNVRHTIFSLFKYNALPVVNENDTVSTEEIKFGDNDNLSALVAILVRADLLIILSDVAGLLDDKKRLVSQVAKITRQIRKFACPTKNGICRGGMISKISAAEKVTAAAIPCIIADGRASDVLLRIVSDKEKIGTYFYPSHRRPHAHKGWIAYGARLCGRIYVDQGAKQALIEKGKSLLSVGVIGSEGNFEKGDVVSLIDEQDKEFARGRANCAAGDLKKIKGRRNCREVVHRDNLAIGTTEED